VVFQSHGLKLGWLFSQKKEEKDSHSLAECRYIRRLNNFDLPMIVLVLNAGSSSIKYQLFSMPEAQVVAGGAVERIGEAHGRIKHTTFRGAPPRTYEQEQPVADHQQGLRRVSELLLDDEYGVVERPEEVGLIGHRVVHGGEYFSKATLINDEVKKRIKALTPLAPLHNPPNLTGIAEAQRVFPHAKQVAVFDTAFHQTLPDYAFRYPVPNDLYNEHGVRVYGMHGTSHRYVAQAAADLLQQPLTSLNLITIHLGNGCSMAAVRAGQSVDTSMGLTPLPGLMMGTRSGDVDPALVYFLTRETGRTAQEVDQLLNNESGLRGIAGNNDLRAVVAQYEAGDDAARLALEMYSYRIKKCIGAYLAVLGRVDALVFTAGVGENSPLVRQMSCAGLSPLGITIDDTLNQATSSEARAIQSSDSQVRILVVPTNEELAIAQEAYAVVGAL
jgi:acetate kinase